MRQMGDAIPVAAQIWSRDNEESFIPTNKPDAAKIGRTAEACKVSLTIYRLT